MKSTAAKLTSALCLIVILSGIIYSSHAETKRGEAERLANYLIDHEDYSADLAYETAWDFYGLN